MLVPDTVIVGEHRREDYCTRATTVDPDFTADCPIWKAFLLRIMANDQDMVDYLQRVCGHCCSGFTTEHVMFFLHGGGRNGKTTFYNVLLGILGIGESGYAAVAPISTFTEGRYEQHPTDLAMLQGVRLVVASETKEGRNWDISKIKLMTGGDPITARFMRQDFFTYTPQFKIMVVGNNKPHLHKVDEATRSRIHLIPFTVTIPPAERDRKLPDKLRAEHPAILAWILHGYDQWQKQGLNPPRKVREATSAYLLDEDSFSAWLAECCVIDPDGYATRIALFQSWENWANAQKISPGSAKDLSEVLNARSELSPHLEPGTKRAGWKGIFMRDEQEPPHDTPEPPRWWTDHHA